MLAVRHPQAFLKQPCFSFRVRYFTTVTMSSSEKARTAVEETSKDGAFVRKESIFRNFITEDGSSGFPAVANRYHLYISYACPWASRCTAVVKLKGLQDAIDFTVSKPVWAQTRENESHRGWQFPTTVDEFPGATPDTLNGAKFIRDLYEIASPNNTGGKFTVPVLWDKEKKVIVSNESEEICRMLNDQFNKIAKNPSLDLYPVELRDQINELNAWIYPSINNGVYRCGFASKQGPYDEAFAEVFSGLDKCEDILSKQRFLTGSKITEADVRLFVTLIRFDEVYAVHFKANKKLIREYPNLFNYTKEIYQMPGVKDTVHMDHIKMHYYGSHAAINPFLIVPGGSNIDYSAPHDRARFESQ